MKIKTARTVSAGLQREEGSQRRCGPRELREGGTSKPGVSKKSSPEDAGENEIWKKANQSAVGPCFLVQNSWNHMFPNSKVQCMHVPSHLGGDRPPSRICRWDPPLCSALGCPTK